MTTKLFSNSLRLPLLWTALCCATVTLFCCHHSYAEPMVISIADKAVTTEVVSLAAEAAGDGLNLTTNSNAVTEGGVLSATLARTGDTSAALTVNLSVDIANQISFPATVTIPSSATSVSFTITAINDTLADGSPSVTLTAAATGYLSGARAITVNDNDVPTLTFTASTTTVVEGAASITGVVTRNTTSNAASLSVSLSSSPAGQISLPTPVVIPANATSVAFSISAVDDALVDGSPTVTLTAAAGGFVSGSKAVVARDNDPALILALSGTAVTEGGAGISATVRRTGPTTSALTVNLAGSPAGQLKLPATATIAAGATTSAAFSIGAVNDAIFEGAMSVNVVAGAAGMTGSTKPVGINDNDVRALKLMISVLTFSESGSPISATISRNTAASLNTTALSVTVNSSMNTAVTVPTTVIIPAGAASVSFLLTPTNDSLIDGSQGAAIAAGATGFVASKIGVTVTDDELDALSGP